MDISKIIIRGARVHNLKNIDLDLPRNKLIVMTGLSGSGKSSLAFDTLYAEGQRRYVESLSAYARQFLGQMDKPDVDAIEGLSPAISIDQKTTSHNPRSTVGTVTEIHDYLRLLYARVGTPHCPQCGREIRQQTVDQMIDQIMQLPERTRLLILAPIVRGRKGEYVRLVEDMGRQGFVRVRIDGTVCEIADRPDLDKNKKHTIEVVVDRLTVREDVRQRLADAIETSMRLSGGLVVVSVIDGDEMLFSQNYACPDCGISIEELTPRMFSFNNPYGACPTCSGLGSMTRVDPRCVIPDDSLSFNQGALNVSGWRSGDDGGAMANTYLQALARYYEFSMDTPVRDLPKEAVDAVLYGTQNKKLKIEYRSERGVSTFTAPFEGVIPNLERRYRESSSSMIKDELGAYMAETVCPDCGGLRLKKESLAVTVGEKSIAQLSDMSIRDSLAFFRRLSLTERQLIIARLILKEINARLGFLVDVGLDYLSLSRSAGTLSGGEAQRIRLATQIGSALTGVMYILDEPSIGLHQRDNQKLLKTLQHLRDQGNTVIVVEHDAETMLAADHLVDIGPGAGSHGGEIVAQGTPQQVMADPASLTGRYLSGRITVPMPASRRKASGWITVRGARANNLKDITVRFPLGVLTCVTGVSGSGKSSLVNEIVYKALSRTLNRSRERAGDHDGIDGLEQLDKIIAIDQSPIGRTPRSNPATYTGVFDMIREVFASTVDAKARGYRANRFSFNVKGGRC